MEKYLTSDILIPLILGAIIGSFFSIAVTLWWVRFTFIVVLTVIYVASTAIDFVRLHPAFFFRVPNREFIIPAFSVVIFGSAVAALYLIGFTPQPNISLIGENLFFVPNQEAEGNGVLQRYLVTGIPTYFNDGQTNAKNVRQVGFVYRRPDPCATHILTQQEIDAFADEVHADFAKRLPEGNPGPGLAIPMLQVADMIPVRAAFQAPAIVGENISEQQLKDFHDGKCVFFFLSRIRYNELRYVDFMRYVFKNAANPYRVERYEKRF